MLDLFVVGETLIATQEVPGTFNDEFGSPVSTAINQGEFVVVLTFADNFGLRVKCGNREIDVFDYEHNQLTPIDPEEIRFFRQTYNFNRDVPNTPQPTPTPRPDWNDDPIPF